MYIIGVDEAGRGPLAGPVSVGAVCLPVDFDWARIEGVNDSKKLSEKKRERIVQEAQLLAEQGIISFHVALISAAVIDSDGITAAVRQGIDECFTALAPNPEQTAVKLDGLLKAPPAFFNQETIIGGDGKEKVIGLASILAKVTRDAHMVALSEKYPQYNFAIHKGYGTKKHTDAILNHGLSAEHRRSYCKRFIS